IDMVASRGRISSFSGRGWDAPSQRTSPGAKRPPPSAMPRGQFVRHLWRNVIPIGPDDRFHFGIERDPGEVSRLVQRLGTPRHVPSNDARIELMPEEKTNPVEIVRRGYDALSL